MAFAHLAAKFLEYLLYLTERCGLRHDGLVLVAQQQEVRAAEIACQHGQLGGGVVLHLVDHHVFCGGVAHAGEGYLQVQPFHEGELFDSRDALADAVHAQPVVVPHRLEGAFVLLGKEPQRVLLRLLFGVHDHRLAEHAQLGVVIELAHHVLCSGASRHLAQAAVQARFQLFADKRDAVRAGGRVLELRGGARYLLGRDEHGALALHVAEVLVLELQVGNGLIDAAKLVHAGVLAREIASRRDKPLREFRPGEDVGVALAHVGQNVVDVGAEHRVGRDEEHLARVQAFALLIEQVGDSLQQHRGFAAAGDAVYQQGRHVFVADHDVLLFLDGGGDGLHLRGALTRKRGQQQLVLDCHGGVEAGVQLVVRDVELAAQLQVDVDGAAVRLVGGGAVGLVVVHLGHGAAPVHHQALVVLVGKAGVADVELFGLGACAVLQDHFREVRLRLQDADGGELVGGGALGAVVRVDDAVHVGVLDVRFLLLAVAGEVRGQLVGHVLLVFLGLLGGFAHLRQNAFLHGFDGGVGLGKMCLLFSEDGVLRIVDSGHAASFFELNMLSHKTCCSVEPARKRLAVGCAIQLVWQPSKCLVAGLASARYVVGAWRFSLVCR